MLAATKETENHNHNMTKLAISDNPRGIQERSSWLIQTTHVIYNRGQVGYFRQPMWYTTEDKLAISDNPRCIQQRQKTTLDKN